jgi:tRNA/tmRNA/rRNA uracil-C5-methylase (TrmA/RlmC/RlmD family)
MIRERALSPSFPSVEVSPDCFSVEPVARVRDSAALETPLVIEQVAFGGQGLARLETGKVCFVPRVIPGERVSVRIVRERKSYAEAELDKVLEASPDRVRARCPVFGQCGGCQYQHMTYARQLALKRDQVADVLRRLGGIEGVEVEPTVASAKEFAYRNRVTVHVRRGVVGFFGERSQRVVDVKECPIATDTVNGLLTELRKGRLRDGEYPLREPGEFRGFRQVNDFAAGALVEVVTEMASPGGALLVDAYCGAGFFAARLKALFGLTVGIEWSTDAIRLAREKAGETERYLLGDVKRHLAGALAAAPPEGTTVLLDPPAEGIDAAVADRLVQHRPARVIYVSCNPATLARDLRRLRDVYRVRRVRPIDMFPQTAEIEVATLLELS